MTDQQAKNLALWQVKEWAIESGEDECQECGGCGYIVISVTFGTDGETWEPCQACNATGANPAYHDRRNFLYYDHDRRTG